MANFDLYFPKLLKHEGGYVNDPVDPGGATNKGITMNTFKRYAKSLLGVEPTLENLKQLSDEQAKKIYKVIYWAPACGDEINHQLTAEIMIDFGINAGMGRAVKKMQQLLIAKGFTKVKADGVCGPITYNAINGADTIQLYMEYKNARKDYYTSLVAAKPELKKFLKGWINRTNSFPDLSKT